LNKGFKISSKKAGLAASNLHAMKVTSWDRKGKIPTPCVGQSSSPDNEQVVRVVLTKVVRVVLTKVGGLVLIKATLSPPFFTLDASSGDYRSKGTYV